MNKIVYILSLLLLLLVSCKEDENVKTTLQDEALITIPDFIVDNPTRTSLVFDTSTGGMSSDWILGTDVLGIYTTTDYTTEPATKITPGTATPYNYKTTEDLGVEGNRKVVRVAPYDYRMINKYGYTAYYPYDSYKITKDGESPMPFNAYPISYRGQVQKKNVDMKLYYKPEPAGDLAPYMNAEREAATHLAPFAYMLATEKRPDENNNFRLPFEHLGCIARFFLRTDKIEGKFVFNNIRVVSTKPVFYKDVLVDMSACSEQPIVALEHLIMVGPAEKTLTLGLQDDPGNNSFMMDYPEKNYSRYIIAYMMLPPVKLSEVLGADDHLYLYLEGYQITNEGGEEIHTPVYFKSAVELDRAEFKAGYLHQWTCVGMKDDKDPIELQAIKVETWKEEVLNNTENGNGTHAW